MSGSLVVHSSLFCVPIEGVTEEERYRKYGNQGNIGKIRENNKKGRKSQKNERLKREIDKPRENNQLLQPYSINHVHNSKKNLYF